MNVDYGNPVPTCAHTAARGFYGRGPLAKEEKPRSSTGALRWQRNGLLGAPPSQEPP